MDDPKDKKVTDGDNTNTEDKELMNLTFNNKKSTLSSIKNYPIMVDLINKRLQSTMQINKQVNNLIINNMSSQLEIFSKTLTSSILPSYFDLNYKLLDVMKPIVLKQNEIVLNIVKQMDPMQEIVEKISKMLKPVTAQIMDNLPKMSSYFDELSKVLEKASENPDSLLNWMEYSEKLSEYIWTIPYDISSDELKELFSIVNSEKEFDKYMLKYFDKIKVEKLFEEILSKIARKHRTIFKQIKFSFDLKNYALINTGLLSVIDELCSQFLLNKGCSKRKDILLPIVEIIDDTSEDKFEVIPILVLNDNINVIYETIDFNKKIVIKTNKKVRRNPSQHGRYFSNRRIDTIMLLNTIYYLLIVMDKYKKYVGRIVYVGKTADLTFADTTYSNNVKRFYIKKKYARKK